MNSPTSISVTRLPCSCGYLAASANDPNLPVKFNASLREYSWEHRLPTGAIVSVALYHCPMCGGIPSESQRHTLFARVPDEEVHRLDSLIHDLETIEDIERTLGAPNEDRTISPPPEFGLVQPRTGIPEAGPVRVLTYSRLSETADVQFTVYSDNTVEGVIAPKYTGAS